MRRGWLSRPVCGIGPVLTSAGRFLDGNRHSHSSFTNIDARREQRSVGDDCDSGYDLDLCYGSPDDVRDTRSGTAGNDELPLTVTAEFAIDATRVKDFQDGIAATRTANAEQALTAHITLTAAASTPGGK